jgi:tellurite resistance protein TerC
VVPVTATIDGEHFFVKKRHITAVTPLFVVLIIIEVMDVLFAVDDVPAILVISSDPFIPKSRNSS